MVGAFGTGSCPFCLVITNFTRRWDLQAQDERLFPQYQIMVWKTAHTQRALCSPHVLSYGAETGVPGEGDIALLVEGT